MTVMAYEYIIITAAAVKLFRDSRSYGLRDQP